MDRPGRPNFHHKELRTTTPSGFETLLENVKESIMDKAFGTSQPKAPLPPNDYDYDGPYDEDNEFYNYQKPSAAKPTPKDPYKDGNTMPKEMKTYWDKLIHGTTPLYDNDYDDYGNEDPIEAYNEYTVNIPKTNGTSGDIEYLPSGYLPRPWMFYTPEPELNETLNGDESVSYAVSGYQIAHAVYMGAVVLIIVANLIMILALLLQPRLRSKASTLLLLNFFVIEVLLSVVDLVFTQQLLIPNDSDKASMGLTLCLVGPWLLHILQAAQPVALFILNVESITNILAPARHDAQIGFKVSALLVLVTWLFGVALASIFVTRSELIESFVVIQKCYKSVEDAPTTMHFLMGLLQLGGPLVVLLASCATLGAIVIRRTSSPHLSADAKSRVRASVIVLLAVSFTYVLVTLPVIIINARYAYFTIPQTTRAWITVQVIRRLGALFFPAFWWSRPDVRHSLKQLPARILCKVQEAPPRPSVISLEIDTETADLLPLELSDPQQEGQGTYRAV